GSVTSGESRKPRGFRLPAERSFGQISVARADGDVRAVDPDADRTPLLFARDDGPRRRVAEQVLVPQLAGDRAHDGVQLARILWLEGAAAGQRGQLRKQRRTRAPHPDRGDS